MQANERTSEWTSKWPSTFVSILVCSRPQWHRLSSITFDGGIDGWVRPVELSLDAEGGAVDGGVLDGGAVDGAVIDGGAVQAVDGGAVKVAGASRERVLRGVLGGALKGVADECPRNRLNHVAIRIHWQITNQT